MSNTGKGVAMSLDEAEEQRELTEWIQNQTGADVFWGEDPEGEVGRFEFTGNGRPDLLAIQEGGDKNTIIAEIKDGQDSGGVYDAVLQLHDYWQQYELGDERIMIDGEPINVDIFVIATQYSPKGRLFHRDHDDDGLEGDDREKGIRQTFEKAYEGKGERPKYAYARSEAIPPLQYRHAWYEVENRRDGDRSNISTGIGVLLSDALDMPPSQDTFGRPSPKVQWYSGEDGPQWSDL